MYGKTHTEKVKKSLRERTVTSTTRAKMSASAKKKFKQRPELSKNISEFASQRVAEKNSFYGKQHTAETKNRLSMVNEGRFRGANGANWQGGKTQLNFRIRQTGRYKRWQRHILERDDYTCQLCRVRGGPLHVDHIKPFSIIVREHNITSLEAADSCPELYCPENGRVLCKPCHKETDTYLYKMNSIIKELDEQ